MNPPRENFLKWADDSMLDAPIYRFMSRRRLEELCVRKENCLVRPILWDDPFENFLFSALGLEADGRRVDFAFRQDFYGQCWTDADESDAMWRIYCGDEDGVRVRCTPRKLLAGLYKPADPFSKICCFVVKVTDHSDAELEALHGNANFGRTFAFDGNGAKQCETLLLKRTAFRHESEVRLLYQLPRTDEAADDIFRYPLDPFSVFDEVLLDPRLGESASQSNESQLRRLGFTCEIRQSTLYRIRRLVARLS